MSGRDLAAEFELLRPHAGLLLMSGHPEQPDLLGRSDDDKRRLVKPFTVRTLLSRVRELLDTNRLG
jgi:hypothetical protein